MKLRGVKRPVGDGVLLEIHIDLVRTTQDFSFYLENLGFEDDPFTVFWPEGFAHHMTGRQRCLSQSLKSTLVEAGAFIEKCIQVGREAGLDFYVEVELARETRRFEPESSAPMEGVLDEMRFNPTGTFGNAKGDVHVEFPSGMVTEETRRYLTSKTFYWVTTLETSEFPAEEIATLQTSTYEAARRVYRKLTERPLENCKTVHLEQKLLMAATRPDLPMPETIDVE